MATANGISLAPDNMEEEVAHLMTFDADTDVAVASLLNAKLEFDEALLNETVALHCDTPVGRVEGEAETPAEESAVDPREAGGDGSGAVTFSKAQASRGDGGSSDEDGDHYLKFSRTVVVCEATKESDRVGLTPPPATHSISQLDGADGGSESDTSEPPDEAQTPQNCENSETTANLTVSLEGCETVVATTASSEEEVETELSLEQKQEFEAETLSSLVLEPCMPNNDLIVENEELVDPEETASQKEVLLDPVTGQFVSAVDGSVVYIANNTGLDKEDSDSADSVVGYEDDLGDPDYSPASPPPRKASVTPRKVKTVAMTPQKTPQSVQQAPATPVPQRKIIKVLLPPRSVAPLRIPAASQTKAVSQASHRPVTSPIVINGLPIAGAPKGKTIAIRLGGSRLQATQPLVIPAQTDPTANATPPPSPQVLLVNRQGQILLKDPRTNTYQVLNTNSPSYNRISQIARMLHSSNVGTPRPSPRVIVAPVASSHGSSGTRVIPASSHVTTSDGRVFIRRQAINSGGALTAVRIRTVAEPSPPNNQGDMAQAIIERAMASHRDIPRMQPIILTPRSTNLSPSQFQVPHFLEKLQSPVAISVVPTGIPGYVADGVSRSQVRVKRVSSACERPGRKKCKTDFMTDLSNSNDPDDSKASGVRIKAPTLKEVLDLDQGRVPDVEKPRIIAPDPRKIRSPRVESNPTRTQSNSYSKEKTHVWVSARHGDLSDWGPCTGFSSDEETTPPRQDKKAYLNQPHLRFEITSDDGFSVKADSIEVAWRAVVDGVLEARAGYHLKQLPLGGMSGQRVLGVLHDAVIFLLEQLQGASTCKHHRFRFHRHECTDVELPLNPSGCARAEVYTRKSTFDMFNFLASQHRNLPDIVPYDEEDDDVPLKSTRRATSTELPMAMRFRHLEKTSKEAVGVYRSAIDGRGLFCKRNIESGEMVIEYAGNVIRSVLTDKREKYYDGKGIGCYMFRIDDFDVVDATMHGNAARFINHSCEPNCYSRVINVDGHKHIVIFALRKIYRGEELTYDYKFPIEDESNKLRCNCGARRCRRFLN